MLRLDVNNANPALHRYYVLGFTHLCTVHLDDGAGSGYLFERPVRVVGAPWGAGMTAILSALASILLGTLAEAGHLVAALVAGIWDRWGVLGVLGFAAVLAALVAGVVVEKVVRPAGRGARQGADLAVALGLWRLLTRRPRRGRRAA